MANVELICAADCPHVDAAREQLRRAFRTVGQPANWQEWDRGDTASPAYVRQFGSPTILIDGQDVTGTAPSADADCCRVYHSQHDGLRGVPPVEAIVSALLQGGAGGATGGRWRSWLVVIPAIGVSLLPKLACPACWPAYAGLLSVIGLGFLTQTKYLLPLTVGFLVVAVGALGIRARQRRGYGPFRIGLVAAAVVIIGKFLSESDAAMYGGIALLIAASLWNTWQKRKTSPSCPACDRAGDHCNSSE